MKAELTLRQIYFNSKIFDFFFRKQARETFEEMVKIAGKTPEEFDKLENAIEDYFDNLDEFEETCYYYTAKYILKCIGIEC